MPVSFAFAIYFDRNGSYSG